MTPPQVCLTERRERAAGGAGFTGVACPLISECYSCHFAVKICIEVLFMALLPAASLPPKLGCVYLRIRQFISILD